MSHCVIHCYVLRQLPIVMIHSAGNHSKLQHLCPSCENNDDKHAVIIASVEQLNLFGENQVLMEYESTKVT